jgi:hypothetical protein
MLRSRLGNPVQNLSEASTVAAASRPERRKQAQANLLIGSIRRVTNNTATAPGALKCFQQ